MSHKKEGGFSRIIQAGTEAFDALRRRIHATLPDRNRHREGYAAWSQACEAFHSYDSPLWPYIDRAYREPAYTEPELLEFAITFLELDPRFFRSGYHKAEMLHRLKRTPLTKAQAGRLRAVLLDAVERRGGREYRRYCRLAMKLADPAMIRELERRALAPDSRQAGRARMMLQYIENSA